MGFNSWRLLIRWLTIEASIPINGLPEDIGFDGEYLWVTVPHSDANFSTGNTVCKIDPISSTLVETIVVGYGPQQLTFNNESVYVSRTFYNDAWETFHGATKINNGNISSINYGPGTPCGGSILKHQNTIFRSFDGGISPMNSNLTLDEENKIGNYNQDLVYHVEKINNHIWFALTDFSNYHEVKVMDLNGYEIGSYQVGNFPGDFAYWSIND